MLPVRTACSCKLTSKGLGNDKKSVRFLSIVIGPRSEDLLLSMIEVDVRNFEKPLEGA